MSWLPRPLRKLHALFRKHQLDADMRHELQHHLNLQIETNLAAGMPPDEARDDAQRRFGHVEGIKETCRDQRGLPWMEQLGRDFVYAMRQLRKAPGFTLVAVLTLAIGIGLTTSIFSIVSSVILEPLPYPHSEQLVSVTEFSKSQHHLWWPSGGIQHEWRQARSIASLAVAAPHSTNFTGLGPPMRNFGYLVWPGYFETYEVTPFIGRGFTKGGPAANRAPEVILNYKLWTGSFGSDRSVIGQTVRIGGEISTIIGVTPPGFQIEAGGPLYYMEVLPTPAQESDFGFRSYLPAVARLKPGVTLGHARSELNVIAQRVARDQAATNKDSGVQIMPLLDFTLNGVDRMLYIVLIAVGFLLLIACVNIANLLLARASGRQREIALRTALGASRGRVVRQLLVESLLLAFLGGVLGVVLAHWSLTMMLNYAPLLLPRRAEIHVDGIALAFSFGLTMITGLGFGILPALQASRVDLTHALKDGGRGAGEGRGRSRLRHTLVVIELSLALVLLAAAGLLGRSFMKLLGADLGYQPDDVYVSRILLLPEKYPDDTQRRAFVDRLLEQFAGKPNLVASAVTTAFPHHQNPYARLAVAGQAANDPAHQPYVTFAAVTPDYFNVIRNLPLNGRAFDERDRTSSPPVAIVSESLVKKFLPEGNPLGRRIALDAGSPDLEWREIVGIVRDVKIHGPAVTPPAQVYVPFDQMPMAQFMEVVRVRPGAPNPTAQVTAAIQTVDPEMPVPPTLVCIKEYVADSIEYQRFAIFLFGVFSTVALILAALGIYGVMAYAVSQRTNEIGVRMALGAQPGAILRMILGQAGRLILLGLLIGGACSFAATQLLRTWLYETNPHDAFTLAAIAGLLTAVALLACWIPARRATKIDPMIALRNE